MERVLTGGCWACDQRYVVLYQASGGCWVNGRRVVWNCHLNVCTHTLRVCNFWFLHDIIITVIFYSEVVLAHVSMEPFNELLVHELPSLTWHFSEMGPVSTLCVRLKATVPFVPIGCILRQVLFTERISTALLHFFSNLLRARTPAHSNLAFLCSAAAIPSHTVILRQI